MDDIKFGMIMQSLGATNEMSMGEYYVDDNGIYKRVDGCCYQMVLSKEVFVEAYKKWIEEDK